MMNNELVDDSIYNSIVITQGITLISGIIGNPWHHRTANIRGNDQLCNKAEKNKEPRHDFARLNAYLARQDLTNRMCGLTAKTLWALTLQTCETRLEVIEFQNV